MVVAAKRYHSPKDYLDAAKLPETSSSELEVLAKSEYDFVQIAVVRHPHVTPEILRHSFQLKSNLGMSRSLPPP